MSSSLHIPTLSGEERGETAVFAGYGRVFFGYLLFISFPGSKNVMNMARHGINHRRNKPHAYHARPVSFAH